MSVVALEKQTAAMPAWVELGNGIRDEQRLWLRARREAALTALTERGFPTVRDEEWKYTSISQLNELPFQPDEIGPTKLSCEQADALDISLETGPELVFVNGRFSAELSRLDNLPQGVRVESLAMALQSDGKILEAHLAKYADVKAHPFTAFNTMRLADGALIILEPGIELEQPIHLRYLASSPQGNILAQPRNLIVAGDNSRAVIVESYGGLAGEVYFTNAVTEVVLGEAAGIEHYKVQHESQQAFHVAALHVRQGPKSYFRSWSLSFGAALSRYDSDVRIEEEGAECSINGLYLATGSQHVDNHLKVDHLKPHGTSRLFFKGVLDDKGRAVFNGKVVVHEGASKTNADQTTKNLLLSHEAEADPKPELEIYHNDVKCTHGATIGQLDEEALFYLRSRGIGLQEARQIMTIAFADEVLKSIKLRQLRAYCECQLIGRLAGKGRELK